MAYTQNHIKANKTDNTLRGLGKMGYTESSRTHGIKKRLSATFDDGETELKMPAGKKHKVKVKCPGCGKKFHTNKGKIPQHKTRWSNETICNQNKPFNVTIDTVVKEVEVNGLKLVKGDKIITIPYPFNNLFNCGPTDVLELEIEGIFKMKEGDWVYFKFKNYLGYFPTHYFNANKNFLKV